MLEPQAANDRLHQSTGIKDHFFQYLLDNLALMKRANPDQNITALTTEALRKFPKVTFSPVWRIRGECICLIEMCRPLNLYMPGLNPHSDTPVEILHVILLGVVKYFWRASINELS